jgi:hypothetical protein
VKTLTDTFGTGPGVKAAAYINSKTGADGIFIRLAKTTVSAVTSAVDKTLVAGTAVPTVSGTPLDGYDVQVVITTAGTIGTSFSYKYSLDGGETFTAPISAGSSTSLTLTGTGLTIGLTSTQTFVLADVFTFYTLPASESVQPVTTTRSGTSTCVVTVTGTPEDTYEARVEVLTGGTIAAAGIVFRYSLDGGRTFSGSIALGTAVTYALKDGPISTEAAGISLAFAAGTLEVGDYVTFTTTGPEWQASDAEAALAILRSGNLSWSFLHGVGTLSFTTLGALSTVLASWATKTKFSWHLGSVRDWGTYEPETAWIARLLTARAGYASTRSTPAAGYSRTVCPITGRQNRRPASWNAVARAIRVPVQVDIGQQSGANGGALEADVLLHDSAGLLVEHDANANSALYDAGFIVLRSFDDQAGVWLAGGNLMGAADDLQRLTDRRVLNIVNEVTQRATTAQLLQSFRRWKAPVTAPYVAGDIFEPDAVRIERFVAAALKQQVVALGMASGVEVTLTRTPVSIGVGLWKLVLRVKVNGLAYIGQFTSEVGFIDPALDKILNAA